MTPELREANAPAPRWIALALALALIPAEYAGQWLQTAQHISLWYPTAGVGFAILLLFGSRLAPLLLLARVATTYAFHATHSSFGVVVASSIADVVCYATAANVARRLGLDVRLSRTVDAWRLMGAGLVGALCAGAATTATSRALEGASFAGWPHVVFSFWLGDGAAIAAFTPALLVVARAYSGPSHARRPVGSMLEVAAQALLLGGCVLWAVHHGASETDRLYPLLLPVIWFAVRQREGGAAYAATATGIGLSLGVHQAGMRMHEVETVQLFFLALAGGAVCLGTRESDRRAVSENLTNSVSRLRHAFESATDAFVSVDADGQITEWNATATRLFGWSAAEAVGRNVFELIVHEHRRAERKAQWPPFARGDDEALFGRRYEAMAMHRDGHELPVEIVMWPGQVAGEVHVFARDITAVKAAESLLRESEERMRLLVESSTDYAIFMLDPTGTVQTWNLGAQRITGYAPQEIVGHSYARFFSAEQAAEGMPEAILGRARDAGRCEIETWHQRKDGTRFWASAVLTAMHDPDGSLRGFAKVTRDLTERREAEERLTVLATHDSLTGLPNRALIIDRLTGALQRATNPERGVAVLFVDLDRFKVVNDSWGHDLGDQLLQLVADRIRSVLRSTDTACRLGGDEFVVVCEGFDDAAGAAEFAERIEQAIGQPASLGGRELAISASIGVALAGNAGDPVSVLDRADRAMYVAKENGRGRHHVLVGGSQPG